MDAFLRALGRGVLSIFFREIEVTGADNLPVRGPVIVVANHFNSLIDGVLVTCFLPRIPRLLAASTVWDNTPVVPFLNAAGVIPLYRTKDVGRSTARSNRPFSQTSSLLQAGGILALFPEGVSHNRPHLMPVRSGAARIALEAEDTDAPLSITFVPVGLTFEAKTRFRSRALMQIGTPIAVAQPADNGEAARRVAVRRMTGDIQDGLAAVTLNAGSWEDARLVARAAEIWDRPQPDMPTEMRLTRLFELRHAFGAGYARLADRYPDQIAALRRTLQDYDGLLQAAGLRDAQVGAAYPFWRSLRWVAGAVVALVVRLPLAGVGLVLNVAPMQATRLVARRQDVDKIATWAVFSSLFLFPLFWLAQSAGLGLWAGQAWGVSAGWITTLVALAAAPLGGQALLGFGDRRRRLFQEVRAWLITRTRRDLALALTDKRARALHQISELAELDDVP